MEDLELDITIPSPETDGSMSHFSVSILADNLINQINNNEITESPNNFLNDILLRFNYLANKHQEEGDILREVNNTRFKVLQELTVLLLKKFDLELDDVFDDPTVSSLELNVDALYHFLIINRFDNVINFIIAYVYENKSNLSKYCKTLSDRKDFDLQTTKRIYANYDDAVIIHNIELIVDFIISESYSQEEFLDYCFMNEESKVHNIVINDIMELTEVNNLSSIYFNFLKEDASIKTRLVIEIKAKLNELFERK